MKKHTTTIVIIATIAVAFGMIAWAKSMPINNTNVTDDASILSTDGLHWHPELEIYIKGVKQDIPNGVGLAGAHKPMHTHDDVPIIHLEFPALVTKEDTRLGKFFENWGKDFREFGETVTMTVNSEVNTEYENYEMKDGDKIELRYE